MARLRLHRDLSYCRVDDGLVFLDIQNDSYFRIAQDLESALVKYLGCGQAPDFCIRRLIERKILVDGLTDSDYTPISFTKTPTRSAMEEAPKVRSANISELMDTFAIVYSVQRQLNTRSLKQILGNLVSLRQRRASHHSMSHAAEARLMEAACAFRSARLYVPIDMCCLLDSIAMIRFLGKRDLHAELVFGVTGEPFSAHCWVQHGITVLNDALGHALAFTPIRVV